jgi:hypothetical protein
MKSVNSQVSSHVALDGELSSAPGLCALEWLLPGVRVGVDLETGRSREPLSAVLAYVTRGFVTGRRSWLIVFLLILQQR